MQAVVNFVCPKCQAVIYSRKHQHCGACGAELPAELLLSEDQVRKLEAWRKAEGRRAKDFDLGSDSLA
jgi:hypothetical protein